MEIVNFLREYWSFIATAILLLLQVVLIIIKRRPKRFDEFVQVIQEAIAKLPMFICEAEETGDYSGIEKKELVLAWCLQYCEKRLGHDLNDFQFDYFYKSIATYIEKILACPTKKGGLGRDEEIE